MRLPPFPGSPLPLSVFDVPFCVPPGRVMLVVGVAGKRGSNGGVDSLGLGGRGGGVSV